MFEDRNMKQLSLGKNFNCLPVKSKCSNFFFEAYLTDLSNAIKIKPV